MGGADGLNETKTVVSKPLVDENTKLAVCLIAAIDMALSMCSLYATLPPSGGYQLVAGDVR